MNLYDSQPFEANGKMPTLNLDLTPLHTKRTLGLHFQKCHMVALKASALVMAIDLKSLFMTLSA